MSQESKTDFYNVRTMLFPQGQKKPQNLQRWALMQLVIQDLLILP